LTYCVEQERLPYCPVLMHLLRILLRQWFRVHTWNLSREKVLKCESSTIRWSQSIVWISYKLERMVSD
jgi:hypothetical protein